MDVGKLKPREGADFLKVTQLVGFRADARSQVLLLNTHFVTFAEAWWVPGHHQGFLGAPICT